MKAETMAAGSGAGISVAETSTGMGAFALLSILFFMIIASENFSR